jgi:hypothetical protein
VQGIVQSLLFSLDLEYSTLTDGIVGGGRIPAINMTFLEGPLGHLHLQMCNDVPHGQSPYPCITIFNSTAPPPAQGIRFLQGWDSGVSVLRQGDSVNITTRSQSLVLTGECIQTMLYPSQVFVLFSFPSLLTNSPPTASGISDVKISPGFPSNFIFSPSPSSPSSMARSHTSWPSS